VKLKSSLFAAALLILGRAEVAVAAPSAQPNAPAPATRVELCADYRIGLHGPACIRPLTPEEQSHRSYSFRMEYAGSNVARRVRINGRGNPDPDDEDCTEHRYRYIAGELVESTGYAAAGSVCERALYTEHATRISWVDAWGRTAFANDRLYTEERVERDAHGFVSRSRLFGPDGSAVRFAGTAYETRFERDAQGLEQRICYFDEHGQPAENGYRAHCLSFVRDSFGTDIERRAIGVDNQPSADFAGGQRYVREADPFGNVLVTHFYQLDGTPISTEDGHCPVLRFQYDEHGFRTGGECLDGQGHPARYRDGHAVWRGSPDALGYSREGRYFDVQGNPFNYESGFARFDVKRDHFGRVVERRFFLADGTPGQKNGPALTRFEFDERNLEVKRSYFDAAGDPTLYKGCAALETAYDSFRQATRRSCRGKDGKLTRGTDGAAVTEWRYDAKGLLSEERFFDESSLPSAQSDGYVRVEHHYDALGQDHESKHFAPDGSEMKLRRFKGLIVRVPHSDAFWPGHSREEALGRIESARRELVKGMPFDQALREFGDMSVSVTHPGDMGYMNLTRVYSAIALVNEPLRVGEFSEVVEIPYGFALYQRSE
jgi:YD repeat-containing protein